MSVSGFDNSPPRANGAVPPPRGATAASFTLFASLAALLAIIYAGSEWLTASGAFGFPSDAAWVRATFARSLAAGHGLSYNTSAPVGGAAAPSWLLALGLGALFSGGFVVSAKLLGVASVALAAMLAWAIALRLLEDWRFAFLAGLLTAASPLLSAQSLGGAEGPFAALLVMAAIYWQGMSWNGNRRQRVTLAVAVGLGALARPELILLLPLVLLDRVLTTAVRSRHERCFPLSLVRGLGEAAGAALIALPYVLYNLRAGGPWWQRPELAIRAQTPLVWTKAVLGTLWANNPMLLLAAGVGLVVLALAAGRDRAEHPTFLPALIPVTLLLLPGFLWPGASTANSAYAAAYLTPLICVSGAAGLFLLYRAARPPLLRAKNRASRLAFGSALTVVLLALFGVMALEHAGAWEEHGRLVKRVNSLGICAGKWAAQHLPPDASIASREVGGIGFFGQRRVVDLGGTISSEGISYLRRSGSLDTNLLAYLEKTQPSHLAIRPGDFPDLAKRADLLNPAVTCVDTDRDTGGATTLVLYETPWPSPSIRGLTGE
jgi:MFS family permease